VRTNRLILLAVVGVAVLMAVLDGMRGVADVAPFLLVVALLVSGRFIGEERILARRFAVDPPPAPRVRRRWTHRHERPLASLLQRTPRRLRGPPAPAAVA
jgi:hypothetical protein